MTDLSIKSMALDHYLNFSKKTTYHEHLPLDPSLRDLRARDLRQRPSAPAPPPLALLRVDDRLVERDGRHGARDSQAANEQVGVNRDLAAILLDRTLVVRVMVAAIAVTTIVTVTTVSITTVSITTVVITVTVTTVTIVLMEATKV